MRRPNPAQWLAYQFGGKLPDSCRDWVLADATAKTWLLRQLVRTFVRITPVVTVLLLLFWRLGADMPLAGVAILLGVCVAIFYGLTYGLNSTDHRIEKYGYPPNYASKIRTQRYDEAERRSYDDTWRS
jgi:hypothetical protein